MSSRLEAGTAALGQIEKERAGALAQVLGTWSADSSSKAATVYFLETTVPQALDALGRRLHSSAETDESWRRWTTDANDVHEGINQVLGYKGEWSMLGVLLDAARATAGELGTAAQSAVKGAGVGAGVVAFLVLGYIAWKVLR